MDASNNNLNRAVEIFGTQVEVNTQVNQFTNTILISGSALSGGDSNS